MMVRTLIITTVLIFSLTSPPALAATAPAANLSAIDRAALEKELQGLEAQIAAQQTILQNRQRESVSLERDIAILTAQIDSAKLSIKARNLSIERLNIDIQGKSRTIGELSSKLVREKESLSELIRRTNELDQYSLHEFLLGSGSLSEFFKDFDTFDQLKDGLQESAIEIKEARVDTEEAKETLEEKKQEQLELRRLQELQKKKIEVQEKEKQ